MIGSCMGRIWDVEAQLNASGLNAAILANIRNFKGGLKHVSSGNKLVNEGKTCNYLKESPRRNDDL